MSQEKPQKKITDILNNFLEQFDCTAEFDTDFAYYPAKNLITYSLIVTDKCSKTFLHFVENYFPDIHADIFLWSLMHEIGHVETEDDFDDDEWNNYMEAIFNCDSDMEYYQLSIERAATDWAANYMRTHTAEVTALWNKLQPAIIRAYKSF